MQLNWKRIALAIAFLAGVVFTGWILYILFLRPLPTTPQPGTNTNTDGGLTPSGTNTNVGVAPSGTGGLPTGVNANVNVAPGTTPPIEQASAIAAGGKTQIRPTSDAPVTSATLDGNGRDVLYYNQFDGKFYRQSSAGTPVALSPKSFPEVQAVTWSPDRKQAVLEFPDGANVVYNFSTNSQVTLPKHWTDFSFAPSGTRLVFKSLGQSADSRWLAVSNTDGSNSFQVEPIGDEIATVYPSWSPNNQVVAMYTKGTGYDRQDLFFVGLNQENFPLTKIEGRGFNSQWTPQGNRLLYSVYNEASGNRPTLWIVDAQGDSIGLNRRNLGIQTWADKCSLSGDTTVYCAVPRDLPENAGVFRSQYDAGANDIYKIDLETGYKSLVAQPALDHTITSVQASEDGQHLYFTSGTDNKLYQIRLR